MLLAMLGGTMNLQSLYEKMSNSHIKILAEGEARHISPTVPLVYKNDRNGLIHSLIEPFSVMFWRNKPDGQLLVSINSDSNLIPIPDDQMHDGRTHIHRHDYVEMAYVVKGAFSQLIGGQKKNFTEGSVCIIDRNIQHADYIEKQDNFIVFLLLKEDFFSELFISEIDNSEVQRFIRTALLVQKSLEQFLHFIPRRREQNIYDLVEAVVSERIQNNKGSVYIIKGLMIRIFDILAKHYEINLSSLQLKQIDDLLFIEVEEYLRNNFKDASLNQLAERFHFQEDYFTKLIKKHTGITYSHMLKNIRMAKAEELLLKTKKSVSEIIEAIGYENRSHFYEVFHKLHNMTPVQFRNKYQI